MKWVYYQLVGFAIGFNMLAEVDLSLSQCGGVDIREITINSVHQLFREWKLTSLELTNCYLKRIHHMNPVLNAVVELNPDARLIANHLDKWFNKTGEFKGPLHGVPILVKDNIGTYDKMNTTAGSYALLGAKPKRDANVISKLRKAGAIILGKTNLSEFAGLLSTEVEVGWSARGGQTINPYRLLDSPRGSSSGSAVAVAANLALVSLGTETQGSIVNPASAASLVGSKPSVGLVSMSGVVPVSLRQDSVGVLARTLQDNLLVTALISDKPKTFGMDESFKFKPLDAKNLHVGFIKFPYVKNAEIDVQMTILEHKINNLIKAGSNVTVVTQGLDEISNEKVLYILSTELKYYLNKYLQEDTLPNQPIKTLEDVIQFNNNNSQLYTTGFDQNLLTFAQSTFGIDDPIHLGYSIQNQMIARKYTDTPMEKHNLDALIALSHPDLSSNVYADILGYPIITVPLGILEDGSPFGANIYSKWGQEYVIYSIARALDPETSSRETPRFLI